MSTQVQLLPPGPFVFVGDCGAVVAWDNARGLITLRWLRITLQSTVVQPGIGNKLDWVVLQGVKLLCRNPGFDPSAQCNGQNKPPVPREPELESRGLVAYDSAAR